MTLLKAWSFDNWTDDDYHQRINYLNPSYLAPATDRFGTSNGAYDVGVDSSVSQHKLIDNRTTNPMILGVYRKTPVGATDNCIFAFADSQSTNYYNARIHFNTANTMTVYSYPVSNDETFMFSMPLNVYAWHFIEIEFYPHDTSGYIDIHIDGVQVYYNDDADTWYNGYINQNINGYNRNIWHTSKSIIDDMYIIEADATAPNDFLGPIHIESLSVSANGTTNNGTASAGSNYECVDEAAHNDDTDYVVLDAVDEIELYTIDNLSITSGTIHAVILNNVSRKVADEARAIQGIVRVNSTNYASGDDHYLMIDYDVNLQDIFLLNPDDSAAWAIADVNAMESGVKITA